MNAQHLTRNMQSESQDRGTEVEQAAHTGSQLKGRDSFSLETPISLFF